MAIDALLQQLINALSLGSIYALLALGLAMVYSTLGILNFAYGELITIAGYTMFFASEAGLPFVAMAALGVGAAGSASVVMQFVVFRPLRGANFVTLLFASFALSQVLQGLFRQAISPRSKGIPTPDLFSDFLTIEPAMTWKAVASRVATRVEAANCAQCALAQASDAS